MNQRKRIRNSNLAALFLLSVFGVLGWRLFSFIDRYSVNILFWDQWAFYTPLFQHQSLWQIFSWQHGPHRQGLGLIVTNFLANWTSWNSRTDAFAVGVVLCLALVCAFFLKYHLFRSVTFIDVVIPFLFLTLFQYEALIVVPNLSHGVFPLLMIMLYCLGLLLKNPGVRYVVIIVLNFLLIYTGFGLFMGPLTIVLLFIDSYQNRYNRKTTTLSLIALFLAMASSLSFLVSYHFEPAIPNFGFSISYLPQYPLFISLTLAGFWGWRTMILGQPITIVAGTIWLVTLIAVLFFHGRRLIWQGVYANRVSLIITLLISYSLLFCLNTAIGRIPLGLDSAQASRYVPLIIPAYLALFFHLLTLQIAKRRQLILLAYLAISIVWVLPIPTGMVESRAFKYYTNKTNWKACYLRFEDIEKCNQLTDFRIYPVDDYLIDKMAYLKERHLNLFIDTAE
jgi:hypothetical protein